MKRHLLAAVIVCFMAPTAAYAATAVRVMVLTAFPPELSPWLSRMHDPVRITVTGAYAPVWCEKDGMCVTETGEGELNAALTVSALLSSPRLDLRHALFLRAGIAGGPPWGDDTLGSGCWANWVVSWALGHHLTALSHGAPEPLFLPMSAEHPPIGTRAFELNPRLVAIAYRVTAHVHLADDAAAIADRKLYPTQAGRKPNIAIGATITGDDFWSGVALSRLAQRIVSDYSHGQARYCTTAMEDIGDASALSRRGLLSHYLSLRTISDFDQPPPGQTAAAMLLTHRYPGGRIALENAYRIGITFVDYALAHPSKMTRLYATDSIPAAHYPLTAAEALGATRP